MKPIAGAIITVAFLGAAVWFGEHNHPAMGGWCLFGAVFAALEALS